MPNAKDLTKADIHHKILLVGPTGAGKTSQIWTLPGKKFAYLFDPNAKASLVGCDLEYEEFLPDGLELDATIKGFSKGSRSDAPASKLEPTVYNRWIDDITKRSKEGYFKDIDWVIIDSLTFLQKSCMDRQLYLNNRYGKIEELADYRVVGSKLSDVFRSLTSEKLNLFLTGHIKEFQDELTKRVTTELNIVGQAKATLPLMCTNIFLARAASTEKERKYEIQTRPEKRGLQSIRSSLSGLEMIVDVTIHDFNNAEQFGIGKLLQQN